MSTKPASKAAKHSALGHKKKGGTPEMHGGRSRASSFGSMTSEGGERGGGAESTTIHPLDEVLTGVEVEALRITEEKLRKLHPPHSSTSHSHPVPPLHTSTKQVMVRRAKEPKDTSARKKRVAVLRPVPAGVSVGATRTLELGGAKRGGGGGGKRREAVVQHSVLGSLEEYTAQVADHGLSEGVSPPAHTAPVSPPPHVTSPHTFSYRDTIVPRETHALQYWSEAMEDRKHQQNYLAERLQKSPERLAMNYGDGYRQIQEERMRIDRAIPSLDYGKGYRVGSEFWSQAVPIGDAETGINTTLTRSEKGQPLPLELVGIPNTVRKEKGMSSTDRNAPLHYTWQATPYLTQRTHQLQSTLTADVQAVKPDTDELEVIGHAPHHLPSLHDQPLDSLGEEDSYSEDSLSSDDGNSPDKVSPLDGLPDAFTQPLMGPALTIRGHLLKWEGPPKPDLKSGPTGSEPVDLRVTFESGVEDEVTSHLEMENCGTTAIYYSWKRLSQPNPLQTVQAGDTQRFYFDISGGALLPGQQLCFPFVFKSPNAGIFKETWALQTGPVLAGGRGVRVMLRGVAFEGDTNAHKRDELERELNHKIAVAAAERLINQIVDSIATPPHSPPPLQSLPTEEYLFRTQNPHLFYHYNKVQQLKSLYNEILRPEFLEDHPPQITGDTPTTGREKGKAAAAGGGGGGKKDKERRGSEGKEKKGKSVQKESVPEMPEEPSKPVSEVPDWDLSTDSLLEVVLGMEEDEAREEKLKLLSGLLGELSFPPPTLPPVSSYTRVYQLVGEMVEQISAASQSLCQVMGLPQRESCPAKATSADDDQLSSTASSAAVVSKKEKEKKGKKLDTKKGGAGKDKERAPSRGKGTTGRKSRSSVGNKGPDATEPPAEQQQSAPQPVVVDPALEKKYRDNFHTIVYGILADTVDKMLLEQT